MATIVIKDLPDSLELDREAMHSITGGSRSRRHALPVRTIFRSTNIIAYPRGFGAANAPGLAGAGASLDTTTKQK